MQRRGGEEPVGPPSAQVRYPVPRPRSLHPCGAHHVAGDPAPTPRALPLGAGPSSPAGPGQRGTVPRELTGWVPRAAQRQEQVSALPFCYTRHPQPKP